MASDRSVKLHNTCQVPRSGPWTSCGMQQGLLNGRFTRWKRQMGPAAAGIRREEQDILYMRSFLSVHTVFSTEVFFALAQTSWWLSPFAEESQCLACLPSTSNTDVPGYLMSWNDVEWRSNYPRAHIDNRCTEKTEIKPRYSQTQFKVMAASGCDAACGSQGGTWGSRTPCLCNSLLENNHFPFLFSLFW